MAKKNYDDLANSILDKIGGKDNISFFTHCVTRLRFNLKDESLAQTEEIEKLKGVIGFQWQGGQLQIIIGNAVRDVYDAICKIAGISQDDDLEAETVVKEKKTLKGIVGNVFDVISGCMVSVIPVMVASGFVRVIPTICGPMMLNIMSDQGDLYRILTIVGDAGFYFLPIFIAFSAAKRFKCSPYISMLLATILIHPSLLEIVAAGENFTVYGIPMKLVNYSSSVLPMLLSIWIYSYIEKLLKKYVPEVLQFMLVPFLSVLIMLPLELCVLGPAGTYVGEGLSYVLFATQSVLGPIAPALLGGLWTLLVSTGMHSTIFPVVAVQFASVGYDNIFFPSAQVSYCAIVAASLVYAIKSKDAEKKSLGISCAITQTIVGTSEPAIFGILFPQRKYLYAVILGGAVGGLYTGIMHVACYMLAASIWLTPVCYGGSSSNILHGIIACVLSFGVAFVVAWVLNKKEGAKNG